MRSVEEIVAVQAPAKAPRKVRAGTRVSPALTDLEGRLSDRFETRVRVNLGATRGRIVVEFASMADLDRIVVTPRVLPALLGVSTQACKTGR